MSANDKVAATFHPARNRTAGQVPACDVCGRRIGARTDGLRRKHRIEDNPAASWCAGSDTPIDLEA